MFARTFKRLFVAIFILFLLVTSFFLQAHAASLHQIVVADVLDKILKVCTGFADLAGFASLTAILINFGKQMHWVTDTNAGTVFAALCFGELVFCVVMSFVRPDLGLSFLDVQAGVLGGILTIVLAYVTQLVAGFVTHFSLANYRIPWFGASFTQHTVRERPGEIL